MILAPAADSSTVPEFFTKRYTARHADAVPPSYLTKREILPTMELGFRNVLIIDDDPYFRSLFKVMLSQAGVQVEDIREAEESNTALALCRQCPFDIVFCDLHLTKHSSQSGIGIIQEVRKLHKNLPVYVVTGDDEQDIVAEVLSAGATGYILKPIKLRTLRNVLNQPRIGIPKRAAGESGNAETISPMEHR
jgi:DNA-binding NarL/FixJ family response regulator